MKNQITPLRTILICALLCVVVYMYGLRKQTIVDRFSRLAYSDGNTLWRNQWFGIPTLQNPNDAWIIQEIISEVKPGYVIETGTFRGGSALLWATVLREVNPNGRVITIDIEDQSAQAKKLDISKKMITFLIGSSTDPKIVSEILQQINGKKAMMILDSDHKKDHVLKELESYAPAVNLGSYIVVQDSNVNGHPVFTDFGPGPMEAIDAFLASHPNFKPDVDRERLLYTTNPRGYLKRIK